MPITFKEVLANREKWISFLEVPSRRKITGVLDSGLDGSRCCLGHGCYVLGVKRHKSALGILISYGSSQEERVAPVEFMELVGLHAETEEGSPLDGKLVIDGKSYISLAEANDGANDGDLPALSPQVIGAYLRTVIQGGDDTPFKSLKDYPE